MFSRLRKRLTYTNVAMTLALVFAMTGGAYAASKFVITSTKQIKPSVLKQLQGKAGKTGAAGANGANGAQGTAGANGKDGANGTNGKDGAPGESVTNTKVEKSSATCTKQGGAEFKVGAGAATTACNGKEGSPWTAGGTLPSEKTETGVWSLGSIAEATIPGSHVLHVPLASFTIPLAAPLINSACEKNGAVCHAHYINAAGKEVNPAFEVEAGSSTQCPGTALAPTAQPGNLCVYTSNERQVASDDAQFVNPGEGATVEGAAGKDGAILNVYVQGAEAEAAGTWAVTAP